MKLRWTWAFAFLWIWTDVGPETARLASHVSAIQKAPISFALTQTRTTESTSATHSIQNESANEPSKDISSQALEEGDVISFRGFRFARLSAEDFTADPDFAREVALVRETWHRAVQEFMTREFQDADERYDSYQRLRDSEFSETAKFQANLQTEFEAKYGKGYGIILDGKLEALYDSAQRNYELKLESLLGSSHQRFEELKTHYNDLAVSRGVYGDIVQ